MKAPRPAELAPERSGYAAGREPIGLRLALVLAVALLGAATPAAGKGDGAKSAGDARAESQPAPDGVRARNYATWERLVAAEELVGALDPGLARLGRSLRNLDVPGTDARALFAESVAITDLAAGGLGDRERVAAAPMISTRSARIGEPRTVDAAKLELWAPFLGEVEYVTDAKFGVLAGAFEDDARTRFAQTLAMKSHARLRDGALAAVSAKVFVVWTRAADSRAADPSAWRIAELHTQSFDLMESSDPPFEEVLQRVLPDARTRTAAVASQHERFAASLLENPTAFKPPHPHFTVQAHDRHPSVSVVDIDRDGYDDVYVMPELGRNMLLVNQRDGTFRDRAAEYGLDIENHCSSAIFADFDNDGDLDVYVGRTLLPSMLLENRDGHFVNRSADLPKDALPALVAALSAVDYDRDGLLDLYVSTYAGNIIQSTAYDSKDPRQAPADLLAEYLAPADVAHLVALVRSGKTNPYSDLPGPPNVLLKNVGGGRFEPARGADALGVFRNTYQASWADFDGDGDDDVYIANDFATHNLVRNDGDGKFTDITSQTGTSDVGFGMGVSWGDYDEDGRQDLYVSNMYSKAGSRITAALPVAPVWAKMARGNTLLRNRGATFEQVSGRTPDSAQVEVAGWSWGGQFADFNNDGRLDLFVPNGYYTAPEEHALPVDI